jgi:hypothetical protein
MAGERKANDDAMLAALKAITKRYVDLAGSGDCGFWDPENEPEVKQARAAIAAAEALKTGAQGQNA